MVKLMLDKGEPFVSANTPLRCGEESHPLLLAAYFVSNFIALGFNTNEKINLLLERGADIMIRNKLEKNCLHLIFGSVRILGDLM
jgi:ankyrin repeat protein